jgi:hypothetical protein
MRFASLSATTIPWRRAPRTLFFFSAELGGCPHESYIPRSSVFGVINRSGELGAETARGEADLQ